MRTCVIFLLLFSGALFGEDVVGFWKTISDTTGRAESIIAVYPYQDKYYGRIILTYDSETGVLNDTIYEPKTRAKGVEGDPFYAGLDIIWDLQKRGDRYKLGRILDPENGKVYSAELWIEKGSLIVRGEILFFGKNQTWPLAEESDFPKDFKKPDLYTLIPSIPQPKKL